MVEFCLYFHSTTKSYNTSIEQINSFRILTYSNKISPPSDIIYHLCKYLFVIYNPIFKDVL